MKCRPGDVQIWRSKDVPGRLIRDIPRTFSGRPLEDLQSTPSKYLLVLKTSWRHVLKTSSTRLQRNNFTSSKTSWKTKNCYAEDVLKTSWRHVLKTSWRHVLKTSSTRLQRNNFTSSKTSWRHVLKTSWRHVLKMSWRHILRTSWRHYGDKQNSYWGYLYLTNLNVYLTNLYLTNLHLTILRPIENALSKTHHFNICLILGLKQHLYSRIKISDHVWCCEISWNKIRHCKKGEAIKTNF